MAFMHRAIYPNELRRAAQVADAVEITVYDADFLTEVGQQFVEAVVRNARGGEERFDLRNPDWSELNAAIEEEAMAGDESVKFILTLPDPDVVALTLKIENHYDGDVVETRVETTAPPPTDDDEWEQDWIFPHTGTGRTEGDSAYFVEVTASSRPELIPVGTEYEFGL